MRELSREALSRVDSSRAWKHQLIEAITDTVPKHVVSSSHKGNDIYIKVLYRDGIREYHMHIHEGFNGYQRLVQRVKHDWETRFPSVDQNPHVVTLTNGEQINGPLKECD